MEFLKKDLQHLFDDQGIDKSQYDDVVEFRDPITRYNNASGKGVISEPLQDVCLHGCPACVNIVLWVSYCNQAWLCAGYMFNISMLKKVFNPTFELHDITQTGEYEATTRWYASHIERNNLTRSTLTCAFLHLAIPLLYSSAQQD